MTNKNNSSNNAILIFIKMPNQKITRYGRGGDRKSKDYLLTLDLAKEIAMLERQGFAVKKN